jgi:Cu/Ag efflux pump CusA
MSHCNPASTVSSNLSNVAGAPCNYGHLWDSVGIIENSFKTFQNQRNASTNSQRKGENLNGQMNVSQHDLFARYIVFHTSNA